MSKSCKSKAIVDLTNNHKIGATQLSNGSSIITMVNIIYL